MCGGGGVSSREIELMNFEGGNGGYINSWKLLINAKKQIARLTRLGHTNLKIKVWKQQYSNIYYVCEEVV